jgi:hypothetical protein
MAIWRQVACWISKATRAQVHTSARAPTCTFTPTRTLTQKYVRYCPFTATMVSRKHLDIRLYVHACFVQTISLLHKK